MTKYNPRYNLFFIWSTLLALIAGCTTTNENDASPEGREAYEIRRLADPETGKIPPGIRMRELAYAATLPKSGSVFRSGSQHYQPVGPLNVGGRTRAFKIDISDTNVLLAGGVSGGMWRSENSGQTWERTTALEEIASVNCLVQDRRPGQTNIWYYGTGEKRGNSASKSGSALYRGKGIFKSVDGGQTWTHLSTTGAEPHNTTDWSFVYNIAPDTTRHDSDIVLAANNSAIVRSNDGGETWKTVLDPGRFNVSWTNVHAAANGIFYAHISSDAANSGIFRSEDGLNWTNITDSVFASTHQRARLATPPHNENILYVYASTPGSGKPVDDDNELNEYNSFYKYTHNTGGGTWEDRSQNLPQGDRTSRQLRHFQNYTMQLSVKPDDENVVFIGATSIFRSTDAFATANNVNQIGGYNADGIPDYHYSTQPQHPDQHEIDYMPGNPDIIFASSDGGVHRANNCLSTPVNWKDLNNGYITTQMYTAHVIHDVEEPYITGGMQDNGTWFTSQGNNEANWFSVRAADGAYCALTNGGFTGYFSTQFANVQRVDLNPQTGAVSNRVNIMPEDLNSSDYLFIQPWTLDPDDDQRMYLPARNKVLRNDNIEGNDPKNTWTEIASFAPNATITAITAARNADVVYIGFSNRTIVRIENASGSQPEITDITANIQFAGYTSNIAVDPRDPEKILAIYSNYNARSLWYTNNGGQSWTDVEGNLQGNPDDPDGAPELFHRGDGPSTRWAQIIPTHHGDSTVILLGTSVGLFAAKQLSGENTVWTQQGAQTIGNVVVDMVDTRLSDGFTAIGTHGNGVFSTTINSIFTSVPDQSNYESTLNIKVFPNPTAHHLKVELTASQNEMLKVSIVSVNGTVIKTSKKMLSTGNNQLGFAVDNLSPGNYFLLMNGETFNTTKHFVKQ